MARGEIKMKKIFRLFFPKYLKRIIKYFFFKMKYSALVHSQDVAFSNLLGRNSVILDGSIVGHSLIGDCAYLNYNVHTFFSDIGRFCSIGQNAIIGGNEHHIEEFFTSEFLQSDLLIKEIRKQNRKQTILKEDVWVGANVIIKKGVTIGRGAIIGAGSVVTKDIPDYMIFAGVPARLIRPRFEKILLERIIETKWWLLETEELKEISEGVNSIEEFLLKLKK